MTIELWKVNNNFINLRFYRKITNDCRILKEKQQLTLNFTKENKK